MERSAGEQGSGRAPTVLIFAVRAAGNLSSETDQNPGNTRSSNHSTATTLGSTSAVESAPNRR